MTTRDLFTRALQRVTDLRIRHRDHLRYGVGLVEGVVLLVGTDQATEWERR